MRILITGATGFLGSHLCDRLVKNGHQVNGLVRSQGDRLRSIHVEPILGDITDIDSLHSAIHDQDWVIHTAAHLSYWNQTRDQQTKVNVKGTHNVLSVCLQHSVKRLVHVSSVAAIGIPPNRHTLADETFQFNLNNSHLNYHLSKWHAETEVLQPNQTCLETVVVNPGTIFGAFDQTFRGGEMIEKVRQSRVVPYFSGGINAVHVEDVVDGICQALQQGRAGERYILGGENVTFRQIVEIAAEQLGVHRWFVPVLPAVTGLAAAIQAPVSQITGNRPRFTHEVHFCAQRFHFYNSQKAKNELGYAPRGFRAIVQNYLEFQIKGGKHHDFGSQWNSIAGKA